MGDAGFGGTERERERVRNLRDKNCARNGCVICFESKFDDEELNLEPRCIGREICTERTMIR